MVSPARLFCIAASRSLPSTLWLRVFINRICCARIETRAVRRPTFVMTSRIAIHSRRTRIAEAAIWRRDQTLEPFELYAQQPGQFGAQEIRHSPLASFYYGRTVSGATVRYTLRVSPSP
jgi:hypothetical protein